MTVRLNGAKGRPVDRTNTRHAGCAISGRGLRARLRSAPRLELEAEGALCVGLARPPRVGAVVPRHAEPLERPLERGSVEARLAEAAHVGCVEQRVALDEVDELAWRAAPVVHLLRLEREQLEAAARVRAVRLGEGAGAG